jgi:hypothetical protein
VLAAQTIADALIASSLDDPGLIPELLRGSGR